jgi:TRAP-type C4-dicarboxylate transport system permease small subunit
MTEPRINKRSYSLLLNLIFATVAGMVIFVIASVFTNWLQAGAMAVMLGFLVNAFLYIQDHSPQTAIDPDLGCILVIVCLFFSGGLPFGCYGLVNLSRGEFDTTSLTVVAVATVLSSIIGLAVMRRITARSRQITETKDPSSETD